MKKLPFKQLYGQNFTIQFHSVLKSFPTAGETFRQDTPSDHTVLLFLHNCSARFTPFNDTSFTARNKDAVLIPANCRYRMEYMGITPRDSYAVWINLQLFDTLGQALCLGDAPFIVSSADSDCANFFDQINDNSIAFPSALAMVYADLYQLFHLFTTKCEKSVYSEGQFASIAKAIDHLRCDDAYTMSIAEMARECRVSESYLRRQFKLYSGMSPAKYVRMRKIMTAKNLLRYSDMSLKEISHRLMFDDVSYFCRIFRQETGMTPSQYRKLHGAY